MTQNRYRYQVWLSLLLWLGLFLAISAPQGQSGVLDDYTFGFWGASREESRMGREDIIAREGYCPTGGCVLRLDKVEVKPNRARRGATLLLSTTYTILTPEHVALPVAITREIFYQEKSLGRTKSIESRVYNGTRTQEIDFTLPAGAAPGIYQLITKISTGYGTAQDRTDFQVD
ncbi:MAG: hypothetical protein FJ121_03245 [Deltaproteobacteria bacterium]|nr:hypothetical protein [Deltaproteobacteria bacterium]